MQMLVAARICVKRAWRALRIATTDGPYTWREAQRGNWLSWER